MHWEERFRWQSERSEGLVARFQLPGLGCDRDHWRRALANGRWDGLPIGSSSSVVVRRRMHSGFWPRSSTPVRAHPCTIGRLWRGSASVHSIFGTSRSRGAQPVGSASHPGDAAQQLRCIRPHDIVVVRGVVTETALRAIWCEAAQYASPGRVDIGYLRIGRLLDAGHRMGLVTWAGLHEMVEDIHERGRSGTTIMRALAEERPPDSSPTESNLESRLEGILDRAGCRSLGGRSGSAATSPSVALTTSMMTCRSSSRPTA